jgi:hypothetical protein
MGVLEMKKHGKILLGVISAVIALSAVAVWSAGGSRAEDADRCPATSKAKCDGLIFKRLGV